MATHSYNGDGGGLTDFGTFQSLGYGDRIWPDVEKQNWQRVENSLMAINVESFVSQEGQYISSLDGETLNVTLVSSGNTPAFEGVINNLYFKVYGSGTDISTNINWQVVNYKDGAIEGSPKTWYLYLKGDNTVIDHTTILSLDSPVSEIEPSEDGSSNLFSILMAKLIVNVDGTFNLVTDIDEKNRSASLSKHKLNNINPHGSILNQDALISSSISSDKILYQGRDLIFEYVYNIPTLTYNTPIDLDVNEVMSGILPDGRQYSICMVLYNEDAISVSYSLISVGSNIYKATLTNTDKTTKTDVRILIKYYEI